MRIRRYALIGVAALMMLGGCGVPSDGTSTIVDKVEQDSADGAAADVKPLKPSTKETATVSNFLGAAAGEANGRDKRLNVFVEGSGEQKWSEPSAGVQLVRISDDAIKRDDESDSRQATVTVTGTIVGVYVQNGRVKPWSGDEEFSQTYKLVRDRSIDVWHIADPPQQVYLSAGFFSDGYEMRPLYFPAASDHEDTLVPDPRWVPKAIVDTNARYTQLTDWLFAGPSDPIGSTVSNAFPEGTSRDKVNVVDDGKIITVDISVDSASQPAKDIESMGAQLAWTLGMSGSQTLKLLVDGQERLTEKVSAWSDRLRAPDEDDDSEDLAYFIANDKVASSEDDAEYTGTETSGLKQAVVNADGDRLAVVAVKSGRDRMLVGPAGDLEPVEGFSSSELRDPQWLNDDTLLVIDSGTPVTVNINSGKNYDLSAKDKLGDVSNLALSPDKRRLAYVAENRTWVSTVLPGESSSRKLGDPASVAEQVSDVGDVGWSRETHLLVIGSVSGSSAWLWEASIDGAFLEVPPGATGDTTRAESLAVRCQPATVDSDLPGEPILLGINGIIHRVYTEISPVRVGDEDAAGSAPFTAS